MGQSTPLASLRWYKAGSSGWYTRQLCCRSGGTSANWENGLTGISWSWTNGNGKSCPWGGTAPGTWTGWGWPAGKQLCRKRPWGSWRTPTWPRADNEPLWQRRPTASRAVLGGMPVGQGRWSFPSVWHSWGFIWGAGSISGLPSARETWTCRAESSKWPQRLVRDWSVWHVRKDCKSWDRL